MAKLLKKPLKLALVQLATGKIEDEDLGQELRLTDVLN